MRALLAAAVYVEVPFPRGPYVTDQLDHDVAGLHGEKAIDCLQQHCVETLDACVSAPTCAQNLGNVWAKVKMAALTAPEEDLLACMLHKKCIRKTNEGWHGTVHRVANATADFAWRQSGGLYGGIPTAGGVDRARRGALRAAALGCPFVTPVTDADPEVKLRSGKVVKDGFLMPRMDGDAKQWVAHHPDKAPACLESFATQAAGGMACLHARGYTHNDFQSHNILFKAVGDGCPRWSLIDFERLQSQGDRPPGSPAFGQQVAADWKRVVAVLAMFEQNRGGEVAIEQPRYPLTQALLADAPQGDAIAARWLAARV